MRYAGLRAPTTAHNKPAWVVDKMILPSARLTLLQVQRGRLRGKDNGFRRGWSKAIMLLTGERAMYELDGRDDAGPPSSMESFANEGLMYPEQVWIWTTCRRRALPSERHRAATY